VKVTIASAAIAAIGISPRRDHHLRIPAGVAAKPTRLRPQAVQKMWPPTSEPISSYGPDTGSKHAAIGSRIRSTYRLIARSSCNATAAHVHACDTYVANQLVEGCDQPLGRWSLVAVVQRPLVPMILGKY
jgi:hypothetical protein